MAHGLDWMVYECMRWMFPETDKEKAGHKDVLARIKLWWTVFSDREREISAGFSGEEVELDIADFMQETLQAIHPRLMWEYGPGIEGKGHRLVITSENDHHLRPLVHSILDSAPTLVGWEFYGYRLPNAIADALVLVKSRCNKDIGDWRVLPSISDKKIDLTFFSPSVARPDDEDAFEVAYVASENLLGEECLNKWIGVIKVMPLKVRGFFGLGRKKVSPPRGGLSLSELREQVEGIVDLLLAGLPEEPFFKDDMNQNPEDEPIGWIYQLEPDEREDYPGTSDMFVGKSTIPDFFDSVRFPYFSSDCFSKHGETFCYLKLDGSEGLEASKFADKLEIEDAVDEQLRDEECGCFIGGGTGLLYSYVDIVLSDMNRGVEIVRKILRDGNVPKRSWIMFYDTHMRAEWIGVYPDSPPPPMDF